MFKELAVTALDSSGISVVILPQNDFEGLQGIEFSTKNDHKVIID